MDINMRQILSYDEFLNEGIFTDIKNSIISALIHLKKLAQEELSYKIDEKTEMIINSGFYKTLNVEHMKFLKTKIDNIDKLDKHKMPINESYFSQIYKQTGILAFIFGGLKFLNPILNFITDTKKYMSILMYNKETLTQNIHNNIHINFLEYPFLSELFFDLFIIFSVVFLAFFIFDKINKH